MPTASDELRAKWQSDDNACDFLEGRGFKCALDWFWERDREPDEEEWSAIQYMEDEWDYGGYRHVK